MDQNTVNNNNELDPGKGESAPLTFQANLLLQDHANQ